MSCMPLASPTTAHSCRHQDESSGIAASPSLTDEEIEALGEALSAGRFELASTHWRSAFAASVHRAHSKPRSAWAYASVADQHSVAGTCSCCHYVVQRSAS